MLDTGRAETATMGSAHLSPSIWVPCPQTTPPPVVMGHRSVDQNDPHPCYAVSAVCSDINIIHRFERQQQHARLGRSANLAPRSRFRGTCWVQPGASSRQRQHSSVTRMCLRHRFVTSSQCHAAVGKPQRGDAGCVAVLHNSGLSGSNRVSIVEGRHG